MCFSASASFSAAGILAIIGMITVQKAKERYRMFSCIPMIFALQQITEGLLWLSFENSMLMKYESFFTYSFLFFAFILWPIWVPLSVYRIEPRSSKKLWLGLCSLSGIFIAFSLFSYLYTYGANASVLDHHIIYTMFYPEVLVMPGTALYLIATIIPFFISSMRWGWLFGVTLFLSYLVTIYFYYQAFVSVWCFFAALLSILVLLILP
jgi:hypothetical protein